MAKPKFLEDFDSIKYKKQLAEHMQLINPKPSKEVLEDLLKRYEAEQNAWKEKYK